jgi:hypothetical protein
MFARIRRALRMFRYYRGFGCNLVLAVRRAWWISE